jgi:hypothetical protein
MVCGPPHRLGCTGGLGAYAGNFRAHPSPGCTLSWTSCLGRAVLVAVAAASLALADCLCHPQRVSGGDTRNARSERAFTALPKRSGLPSRTFPSANRSSRIQMPPSPQGGASPMPLRSAAPPPALEPVSAPHGVAGRGASHAARAAGRLHRWLAAARQMRLRTMRLAFTAASSTCSSRHRCAPALAGPSRTPGLDRAANPR